MNLNENEQLKGITVIIDSVAYGDEDTPYSITRVFRGDLTGKIDDIINTIKNSGQVEEFTQMKNQ